MTETTTVPADRTVAVAGFPYRAKVVIAGVERWVMKFATRGETIQVDDQADLDRGDKNGHFVKDGEPVPGTPPALSLDEIGLMTDEALTDLFATDRPSVGDTLTAVGADKELAQRVLAVEKANDPRANLVEALEKVVGVDATVEPKNDAPPKVDEPPKVEVTLETVKDASVAQLTDWIKDGKENRAAASIDKLLTAVGADKELAARLIQAETNSGDVRTSLVAKLEKVVAEEPS